MDRRPRSQGGESLLELIVAVAILGLGVVALLGGLGTAVFASSLHRSQTDVSAVVTAAAEKVKAAPFMACALPDDYIRPAGNPFAYPGWTGTVSGSIADWDGAKFEPRDLAASPPLPCAQMALLGFREQRLTITAVSSDGKVQQSVELVKRYRDCPTPASPPLGCG
jgi:hypothetical protein